ncbi:Transcriptional regulator OS=Ureibacillus acetophenoni OX=614649 GN=SAMN05877842_102394 PE=4 SV=1 [Ureibacillus acetophenoni]
MKEQLMKVMIRNQLVDMIYEAKSGEITKRRVKVLNVTDQTFSAYCFTKQARRSFRIDHVLSLLPVIRRERESIS